MESWVERVSEALGAPGSPQRTWEDNDFFNCFPQTAQTNPPPLEISSTNGPIPYPRKFPVSLGEINELHAAFLIESHTRDYG
jgi:hypothetical protein